MRAKHAARKLSERTKVTSPVIYATADAIMNVADSGTVTSEFVAATFADLFDTASIVEAVEVYPVVLSESKCGCNI
jgi:hypothetical protein